MRSCVGCVAAILRLRNYINGRQIADNRQHWWQNQNKRTQKHAQSARTIVCETSSSLLLIFFFCSNFIRCFFDSFRATDKQVNVSFPSTPIRCKLCLGNQNRCREEQKNRNKNKYNRIILRFAPSCLCQRLLVAAHVRNARATDFIQRHHHSGNERTHILFYIIHLEGTCARCCTFINLCKKYLSVSQR